MAESGNTRPTVPTLSLSNPQTPSKAPKTVPFEENASRDTKDAVTRPSKLSVSVEAVTEALSALSLLSPRLSSQRLFVQVISCEGLEATSSHDGYFCSLSVEQQIMRTATLEPSKMTQDSESSEEEGDTYSDDNSSGEAASDAKNGEDEDESLDLELCQVQWSQNFSIDVTHPDAILLVEVWARDMTVSHHSRSLSTLDKGLTVSSSPPSSRRDASRLIGHVRIPVNSLPTGQPLERYYRLRKPRGETSESAGFKGSWRAKSRARVKLHLDLNELSTSGVCEKDFIKLKIIGKGSFGTVYQVRHKETKGLFAMKVLHKQQMIEKDAVRHAMAERDVLKSVHHPFLVSLKYAFQTDEFLFLVLDYLNGGELFFHLSEEDEGFGEERTRFYAAELVLAVGYLHDNGIIYRDLKPENVLLTMHGHVCLVDFGLSKTHLDPQIMRTKTFCGSLEYMSPEMLHGEEYGKDIDWWALATMVYEMIDGLPPFWNEDQSTMLDQIAACNLDDQPRFGTRFSENCEDFVRAVLVKDPTKRLGTGLKGTAEIQAHPWFEKIDWRALYRREIPAPWLPRVKDEADTRYVDQTFLSEDPETEFMAKMRQHQANVPNIDQQQFSNFSFEEIRSPRAPVSESKSVSHSRASSRRHSRVGSEKRPKKKHRNKAQKVTSGVSPHASPSVLKKKPRKSNSPSPDLSDEEDKTRKNSKRTLLFVPSEQSPRKKDSHKGSKTPKTPKSRTRSNSTENGSSQPGPDGQSQDNCVIS